MLTDININLKIYTMPMQNILEYPSSSLLDFNTFSGKISKYGFPEYQYKSEEYYLSLGVKVEEIKDLAITYELKKYTNYLLFLGYEFKQLQLLPADIYEKRETDRLTNAKLLQFLRNKFWGDVTLKFLSTKNENNVKLENIFKLENNVEAIKALKFGLEKTFEIKDYENPTLNENISDIKLNDYIENGNKKILKSGAKNKQRRIARLAEFILFVMYYETNKYEKPQDIIKFTNKDCRFVHDYMLLWYFIEDKDFRNIKKTDTRHNYIKSLIVNLRDQRYKWDEEF